MTMKMMAMMMAMMMTMADNDNDDDDDDDDDKDDDNDNDLDDDDENDDNYNYGGGDDDDDGGDDNGQAIKSPKDQGVSPGERGSLGPVRSQCEIPAWDPPEKIPMGDPWEGSLVQELCRRSQCGIPVSDQTMAEYRSLLEELAQNITAEDLEQLKSACREDIPSGEGDAIATATTDNLSYIEHIFEISRRPDLLTKVVQYRTQVLKISEEDEVDTKLTRIPSAKKYKDIIRQPSEEEIIKLAPPPKKA
ncbi:hypothetical protein DUI87_00280 [Hirundo rustica rustica]|uniref:DED domain-containing protein n=1 Tax=Hirundo rustica rustica TaxID=333673 RepID=A0A3M0LBQ9_HIRRU|nr:hypothetical protein DUI87_00280 [Hirundo rustica rustica]